MTRILIFIVLVFNAVNLNAASVQNNKVINKTGFYQPDFLLEAATGSSMQHYEIGMDFQDESTKLGFAGLYLSRASYDVVGEKEQATMTAIGIRGLQLSSQAEDLVGIDLHMGINRTVLADYARTGLEISMHFYENVSENTSLILGGTFRPEFLSLDWSEEVITEFGFKFGVNYNIGKRINLFSEYYYESLWDDDFHSNRIDDGILIGLTCIF